MASLESVVVKGNDASLVFGFDRGNRKVVRMVRFGTPLSASEKDRNSKSNKDDEHWQ
jgi:hypothetical protein